MVKIFITEKMDTSIRFRVSHKMKEKIAEKAAAQKLDTSDYLRELALLDERPPRK